MDMNQPDNTLALDKSASLPNFPITFISFALLIAITAFLWLGSYEQSSVKDMRHLINSDMRALELKEEMVRLNETSRLEARLAILTSNPQWATQYQQAHPLLDNVTTDAVQTFSQLYILKDKKEAASLHLADDSMASLEAQAMTLLKQGHKAAARQLIFSPEYQHQQTLYNSDLEKYDALEHDETQAHLKQKIHDTHNIYIIILTCLSFLIAAWIFTYKNFTRWKKIKMSENRLEELLYRDQITSVYNRAFFTKNLSYAIAEAEHQRNPLAIIYIDLDRFAQINIYHDHKTGDQLLQAVAERLNGWVDDVKHLARVGSDEFALLISDIGKIRNIEAYALEILNNLKQPFMIANNKLRVSTSVGISLYPNHADNQHLLMNYANLALTHCKKMGGDNYQVYRADLSKSANSQWMLEEELHQALERHEFITYYQPIVSTEDGKIVGVEALLRWQHPQRGLLLPEAFVSICEATGLIVPIGAWMLMNACEQIKKWHANGYPDLSIAVNLSARQFHYPGLLELVTAVLTTTQIPPSSLKLEITESLVMQDAEANIALLKSLRNLGVQLSLDDFGTGYSSLSYLRHFPVSILKIDKSFITDLGTKNTNHAIVEAIIALGKSLELTIIAKGIETQAQADILKAMQCDLLQGYLFSRPISAEDFTVLLGS